MKRSIKRWGQKKFYRGKPTKWKKWETNLGKNQPMGKLWTT